MYRGPRDRETSLRQLIFRTSLSLRVIGNWLGSDGHFKGRAHQSPHDTSIDNRKKLWLLSPISHPIPGSTSPCTLCNHDAPPNPPQALSTKMSQSNQSPQVDAWTDSATPSRSQKRKAPHPEHHGTEKGTCRTHYVSIEEAERTRAWLPLQEVNLEPFLTRYQVTRCQVRHSDGTSSFGAGNSTPPTVAPREVKLVCGYRGRGLCNLPYSATSAWLVGGGSDRLRAFRLRGREKVTR